MKRVVIVMVASLIYSSILNAQGNEGNIWVLGYPSVVSGFASYAGGSLVKFGNGGIDTTKFDLLRSMFSTASIADENGELLFYSNGCDIINRNHEIILNGEDINGVGTLYNQYCANGLFAYGTLQDMLILPFPKNPGKYQIIHIRYSTPGQAISQIRYSTVDMSLDGGLGGVVEKNINIPYNGTVNGYMTATRHGNGSDWWITVPEWHTTTKFVFLLDSLGIHGPEIQVNAGILTGSGGNGQAAFSPDGTKYAEVCFFQGQALDFDRCTGKFFNPYVIDFDSTAGINNCAGVAFSPNSRFMYVARCDTVDQFDLSVTDFNTTRIPVATWDGIFDSTGLRGAGFFTLLTAPDDKIYINSNVTKALHIIDQPNELGTTCGYQKWGLELPTIHWGQLPNIPNFKLGAIDPSCMTDVQDIPSEVGFTIFPNPATDYVVVNNHSSKISKSLDIQLYDTWGHMILEKTIDHFPYRLELDNLPVAAYLYRLFSQDGKRLNSGTLIKIH